MPLTETAIRAAKPRETPYKITDGAGLALVIAPNGSKWWRWRYHRHDGRENMLSLGVYPTVTLKMARERRDDARRLLAQGVDLSMKRQSERAALADTFEAVALEWRIPAARMKMREQHVVPLSRSIAPRNRC